MRDGLQAEWRREQGRLYRKGPLKTAERVCRLLREGSYPTWCAYKVAGVLLKRRELTAAGAVLTTISRLGRAHPLTDQLYGKWLWAKGDAEAAIRFLRRRATIWRTSNLFWTLSAMYGLTDKPEASKRYLKKAISLAERELVSEADAWFAEAQRRLRRKPRRSVPVNRGVRSRAARAS